MNTGGQPHRFVLYRHGRKAAWNGRIVGIVFRADGVEDRLVMAPDGVLPTAGEIRQAAFQEKFFHSRVEVLPGQT